MDEKTFLRALNAARAAWEETVLSRSPTELAAPSAIGSWRIQDVIAHVTWVIQETAGMLEARALVGSELWRLPLHERNAAVYELNKDRTGADVLAESHSAHARLISALEAISEPDLLAADWFADLGGAWPPWRVVQVNVIDHYLEHTDDVARWISQHRPDA